MLAAIWGAEMTLRVLTPSNQDYLQRLLTPEQLLAVRHSTAIRGVGLSFLKFDDRLETAKSIAYSLQGCGMVNSARASSVALICNDCAQAHRTEELRAAILSVKKALNLLRSPVRHTGLELDGSAFSEAKIYLQTNIKGEHLVDGNVHHSATELGDDLLVLGQLCGVLNLETEKACAMTAAVRQRAGLGLDMVGLDIRRDGRIELKLYFAPPEGVEGLNGTDGYRRAEEALTALHAASVTYFRPRSWVAINEIMSDNPTLCLNQISVETQPSGLMKSKLYFDLWRREKTFVADQSAADFSFEAFEGLRGVFDQHDVALPSLAALTAFKKAAVAGNFVLDAFCLETLGHDAKVKIYVRPAGNTDGNGLTWEGAQQ
jgi:hypothetical protein